MAAVDDRDFSKHLPSAFELEEYETEEGQRPHARWFMSLTAVDQARIVTALGRLEAGNTSALKSLGGALSELRLNFGAGYRIYLSRVGSRLILLLGGGTKQRQSKDIVRARAFLQDYQERIGHRRGSESQIQ